MEVQRTEHKMILNRREALQLIHRLDQIMPRDAYCRSGDGYEIRSLYFDTLTDACCVEKDDGLLIHEKIRARIYGSMDGVIKLESKRKVGEAQTKHSMKISRETLEELRCGEYAGLLAYQDPMAPYFYHKLSCGMRPKTIVQYKRLSFCIPTNNTRITFDSDIRATESNFDLFQEPLLTHPVLPYGLVILEVKFNHFLPDYIKKAVSTANKSPLSYSKYLNSRTFWRSMI